MTKNTNTFEKRRKEMLRIQKAQDKREKRLARGPGTASQDIAPPTPFEPEVKKPEADLENSGG